MFVFKDMEDYKTRGKNVDSEYAKYLAERKKRGNKTPTPPAPPVVRPEPKPPVVIPKDILGKKVKHKTFGIGTISLVGDTSIEVDFETVGVKKMGYEFCMKNKMLEFIE